MVKIIILTSQYNINSNLFGIKQNYIIEIVKDEFYIILHDNYSHFAILF